VIQAQGEEKRALETMYSARRLPNREPHGITKPDCPEGKNVKRFAQKGICCCTILSSEKDTTQLPARGNPLLFKNLQLGGANTEERAIYRKWVGNK
jgi:hypothetical protein